jgi:hypothetical protein
MKVRIFEGDYSPDDLARFLLAAAGTYREAKKALTRASNDPKVLQDPRVMVSIADTTWASDEAVYLVAHHRFQKGGKRCSDHTALKKLLGPSKYRVFYNRLRERGLTLEQIARLYPTSVKPGQ